MTQPPRGRPPRLLNPDASHAARLGAEIRTRRQAQGLTLKALAARIGFSPQHLSEVERANVPMSEPFVVACDRALDAHGTLEALLPAVVWERALQRHDRSTARRRSEALLRTSPEPGSSERDASQVADPPVDRLSRADRSVTAIRGALMAQDAFAPELTGRPPDLDVLRGDITSGWYAFQSSQYSLLADRFPGALRHGQLAAQRHEGRDGPAAAGLLSMLYQLATVTLLKLGNLDAAWLAADRGVAAAERSEHLLVLGCAGRMLTYVFLDAGDCENAQELGLAAVAALERKPQASVTRMSVLGALYLKTAVAAARKGDRSTAIDLLANADRAAVQLDADRNDYWTAFGPTNVAVHTVSVAVELGDPRHALAQAKRVRLSRLPVPERRAQHLLDVAKAHWQCQQDAEAVEAVLAAEEFAPEEVRLRPATRTLVFDILHRAPVIRSDLRDLAQRLAAA
jgi:transcriptional regulator with XRE-family HTH domain